MKTFILVWLGLCPLVFGEPRDWTTAEGGKTIKAEYVKSSDGKVTLRRSPDRRLFTIDLTTLSEADGEWVKAKELEIEEEKIASEGKEASEEFGKLLTGDWERNEGRVLKYRIFGERKMKRSEDAGYPLVVWLHGRIGDVMTPDQPGQASISREITEWWEKYWRPRSFTSGSSSRAGGRSSGSLFPPSMFSEGVEGFPDPSLVVGSLGILQLHAGEGQPEAKSEPCSKVALLPVSVLASSVAQ